MRWVREQVRRFVVFLHRSGMKPFVQSSAAVLLVLLMALNSEHFKRGADVAVQFRYGFENERVSLLGGDFGYYIFLRNSLYRSKSRNVDRASANNITARSH